MSNRRIWGSIAVKRASLLSPWRGRQRHARRPDTSQLNKQRVGGEAGGTSPPFAFRRRGAMFRRKVAGRERAFGPLPGKSRRRGRQCRRHPPTRQRLIGQPALVIGTAIKRDMPPVLTRIKTLFFLSSRAA